MLLDELKSSGRSQSRNSWKIVTSTQNAKVYELILSHIEALKNTLEIDLYHRVLLLPDSLDESLTAKGKTVHII